MDLLTQGIVGGIVSQTAASKKRLVVATVCGFLAGTAPDLDVLIRSSKDPLLSLEYHRQFTHSLFFIPIGALVCAALFWLLYFRKNTSFRRVYFYSFLGYGTHGLLDSCTSYGTQLFWPFSSNRIAWSYISIVDPLFTLPLLLFALLCFLRKRVFWSRVGLAFALLYMSFGVFQAHRAEQFAQTVAAQRNHQPDQIKVKPSLGNLILFKSIYRYKDRFYIDAIRAGWNIKIFPGEKIVALHIANDFLQFGPSSQMWRDIERFSWLSDGYIAKHPNRENEIIDVRYSFIPNRTDPLWGMRVFPNQPERHVDFITYSQNRTFGRKAFFEMLFSP